MDEYENFDTYDTGTTSEGLAGLNPGLLIAVFLVIYLIPWVIVTAQLFRKADRPSWHAVVPFYNLFAMGKLGETPLKVIIASFFVPFLPIVLMMNLMKKFRAPASFWLLYVLFPAAAIFKLKLVQYGASAPQVMPQNNPNFAGVAVNQQVPPVQNNPAVQLAGQYQAGQQYQQPQQWPNNPPASQQWPQQAAGQAQPWTQQQQVQNQQVQNQPYAQYPQGQPSQPQNTTPTTADIPGSNTWTGMR